MYGTTREHTLTLHPGYPTLQAMQDAVGGYITTADRIASPERDNITLDVWCNDEGLLDGLPFHWTRTLNGQPIAGNLCITATNEEGETIPATAEEVRYALAHLMRQVAPGTPVTIPESGFTFIPLDDFFPLEKRTP